MAVVAELNSGWRIGLRDAAAWAVAMFVFTVPFEEMVTLPGVGSISRLVGMAALAVGIMALSHRGHVRFFLPPLFIVIASAFVAWNLATYFWSFAPDATLRQAMTYVQLLVFVWLMSEFCREGPRLHRLLQAYILGNYVAFGITFFHVLFSGAAGFRDVGRFDPNDFATLLALGIPMAALLLLQGRTGVLRWLNLGYPFVAVLGVVLAASRGGLIVCLVTLAVVPFALTRLRPERRLALLAATIVAVWFSFSIAPQVFPELRDNVERLAGTGEEVAEGTMTGRTTIWAATMAVFSESPIIGVGSGAERFRLAETAYGRRAVAHNAFISVAASTGIIGLLGFGALLLHGFTSAFLARASYRPFLIVLATALLVAMMPLSIEARKATWFVLAVLALYRPILLSYGRDALWSSQDRSVSREGRGLP